MKIIPLKSFLGKPLELKTGNVYYENELGKAIEEYEKQFFVELDYKIEQTAKRFSEWCNNKYYSFNPDTGIWENAFEATHKTTSQLYSLFKKEGKEGV